MRRYPLSFLGPNPQVPNPNSKGISKSWWESIGTQDQSLLFPLRPWPLLINPWKVIHFGHSDLPTVEFKQFLLLWQRKVKTCVLGCALQWDNEKVLQPVSMSQPISSASWDLLIQTSSDSHPKSSKIYAGFLKWEYPQIHPILYLDFSSINHQFYSILGYPHEYGNLHTTIGAVTRAASWTVGDLHTIDVMTSRQSSSKSGHQRSIGIASADRSGSHLGTTTRIFPDYLGPWKMVNASGTKPAKIGFQWDYFGTNVVWPIVIPCQ